LGALDTLLGHRLRVRGARREIVRGTPLLAKLFGAPFLVAGCVLTFAGTALGMYDPDSGEAAPWWANALFVIVVAAPFLGLGLVAVLGQRGTVIDHEAGTLERWWGLVFPMIRKRRKLGSTSQVILGLVTRTSGSLGSISRSSSTLFGVFLDGPGRPTLDTFTNEQAARRFAERAAETIAFPFEDRLLGSRPRSGTELDQPLALRLRDEGGAPMPSAPSASKVRVEPSSGRRSAVLPPFGFDKIGGWILLAVLVGGWGWYTFDMWTSGERVDLGFAGALTGVALALGWMLFGDLIVHERVDVDGTKLTVTRRLGPVPWWRSIPVGEIEEVAFDGDAVQFVSDRRKLRVGGGHSEADCKFLAALVRAWLVELDCEA